jgi:PAS domain S-box-containing protein
MKPGFLDKLIARIGKLEPEEVKNALVRLVQEKGFLEKVFDSLQEGVIVTDVDGQINYVNRAACGFFGLDAEVAIDKRLDSQIRGLDWSKLIAEGQVVSRDIEVFYPENRFLNFYLSPIEDAQIGKDLGYVMIVHDITLTRKLTEEKIESERLSALTLLAAGVAHEVGNPLNSLNIHLQLIERRLRKAAPELYESQFKELLDVAKGEVDRLDFTIAQFLKAIRPTKPVLEMNDINDIIRESARFLEKELSDRQIAMKLELRSNIPPMMLDTNQLKQAFYNIIRNAMQAMSNEGQLLIHSDMDDYEVVLTFSDNGPGISAEAMAQVFDPYFTTKKSGTGLGLLIVRRVVREHGGEIELTSRPNEGTRVVVRLPRIQRPPRFLTGGGEEEAKPKRAPRKKRTGRVIEVE